MLQNYSDVTGKRFSVYQRYNNRGMAGKDWKRKASRHGISSCSSYTAVGGKSMSVVCQIRAPQSMTCRTPVLCRRACAVVFRLPSINMTRDAMRFYLPGRVLSWPTCTPYIARSEPQTLNHISLINTDMPSQIMHILQLPRDL